MIALPPEFLQRLQFWLGDEYEKFVGIYTQPAASGLRVNTFKIGADFLASFDQLHLEPIPWCPAGYTFKVSEKMNELNFSPGRHPFHAAGLYYLQDPSAMAVAEALAPQPGERILDLAAAPGGKTTHLAALMQGKGLLMANEIHPQRVWSLCENLERWGVRNAVVTQESPARLSQRFSGFFDRVLLDAPCSGEGMFRKSEAARLDWSVDLVIRNAQRQLEILQHASRMVRPGGILGYSTCTFAPEENEGVIAKFLSQTEAGKSFALENIHPQIREGSEGQPQWLVGVDVEELNLERAVRLWPHKHAPEGHFIAILRKDSQKNDDKQPKFTDYRYHQDNMKLFDEFCDNSLNLKREQEYFLGQRLRIEGGYIYAEPDSLPDLRGIKVVHPGWWLGELKKNRFEPSHALALGLSANNFRRTINLNIDHPHLLAYLHGESLPINYEAGWTVVNVQMQNNPETFPLGWGKSTQGNLKNAYPKGLRWN